MMLELFEFEFIQHAFIAGILASVICGIIGVLVVVNRITFITAGTAHAAYGGIGLAFFFGLPILPTTLAFSIAVTMLLAWFIKRSKSRSDAAIGILWAGGMALGVVLIDMTPGFKPDLMSYLFGSILTVTRFELIAMGIWDLLLGVILLRFYREFLALSYDSEYARSQGTAVDLYYLLLLVMISISAVLLIRVAGLMLIIALLTIPPLIVEGRSNSLKIMIGISIVLNLIFITTGLFLSYYFDLSTGATIVGVAISGYLFSTVFSPLIRLFPR